VIERVRDEVWSLNLEIGNGTFSKLFESGVLFLGCSSESL